MRFAERLDLIAQLSFLEQLRSLMTTQVVETREFTIYDLRFTSAVRIDAGLVNRKSDIVNPPGAVAQLVER